PRAADHAQPGGDLQPLARRGAPPGDLLAARRQPAPHREDRHRRPRPQRLRPQRRERLMSTGRISTVVRTVELLTPDRVSDGASDGVAGRVATVGRGGDVTLPGGIMPALRLLRPEPFVVFAEGRQFIHMIRADAGPASLIRAERISLHGSIEGFGIADLFSLLNMSRRTGLLLLIADQDQKAIYFRRGEIAFAGSNLPDDRLGQVLYRTG